MPPTGPCSALADDPGLEQVLLVAFDESMAAVLRQAVSAV